MLPSSGWPARRAATGWPHATAGSSTSAPRSWAPWVDSRTPIPFRPSRPHPTAAGTGSCRRLLHRCRPRSARGKRCRGRLAADPTACTRLLGRHHERLLRRQHRAGGVGAPEGGGPPARRRGRAGHLGGTRRGGGPPSAEHVGVRDRDRPRGRPAHGREQRAPRMDAQHVDRRRLHLHRGRRHATWPPPRRACSKRSGWSTGR